jgi:hypothetical protein
MDSLVELEQAEIDPGGGMPYPPNAAASNYRPNPTFSRPVPEKLVCRSPALPVVQRPYGVQMREVRAGAQFPGGLEWLALTQGRPPMRFSGWALSGAAECACRLLAEAGFDRCGIGGEFAGADLGGEVVMAVAIEAGEDIGATVATHQVYIVNLIPSLL